MPDTAIANAFQRAGITSAEDRLRNIAIREMVAHADSDQDTIDAIWASVQKDRSLLVELFKLDSDRAIRGLLYRTRLSITSQQNIDRKKSKIELQARRVVDLHDARQQAREEEINRRDREKQAEYDRQHREHLASWHRTEIGHIEIHGVPVWQVTAGTARAWLETQRRPLRCVELLIEGVPDDGRPIEFYRRPEEVAELWKRTGVA